MTFTSTVRGCPPTFPGQLPYGDVARRETRTAEIDGAKLVAVVEAHRGFVRLGIDVGKQLELDHCPRGGAVCYPTPHSLAVRFEFGVAKSPLEPGGVDRSGGDLEIDLHVDIDSAGVAPAASRAQQLGNEPAEHHDIS